MNPTLTRSEVVEKAAKAILKLEQWRLSDGKRARPGERKRGESRPKRAFASADQIVSEYTSDMSEQCQMLHEAQERAKELREP